MMLLIGHKASGEVPHVEDLFVSACHGGGSRGLRDLTHHSAMHVTIQVPMSLNLIKAGFDVVVYNRNSAKCEPVVAAGGRTARTPREVAELSTYTFAALSGQCEWQSRQGMKERDGHASHDGEEVGINEMERA